MPDIAVRVQDTGRTVEDLKNLQWHLLASVVTCTTSVTVDALREGIMGWQTVATSPVLFRFIYLFKFLY